MRPWRFQRNKESEGNKIVVCWLPNVAGIKLKISLWKFSKDFGTSILLSYHLAFFFVGLSLGWRLISVSLFNYMRKSQYPVLVVPMRVVESGTLEKNGACRHLVSLFNCDLILMIVSLWPKINKTCYMQIPESFFHLEYFSFSHSGTYSIWY